MKFRILLPFVACLLFLVACNDGAPVRVGASQTRAESSLLSTAKPTPQLPDWAASANIYEVNIRQYTSEGTFNAFAKHLPRLQQMGVKILWLMPVFPTSSTKKKGELGSYYAISDYTRVNPDFGTAEDFQALILQIHELGMKVILDWVPNHTGWDHAWIQQHPEWYTHHPQADTILHPKGDDGEPTDWYDVAELNYESAPMQEAMITALEYWVKQYDIDGYRMDVAMLVPDSFWKPCFDRLRGLKDLFLLAESEKSIHRDKIQFNMDYGWTFHHLMNDIAEGKKRANALTTYCRADNQKYQKGFHMYFTSNHDENAWAGTVFERMGEAHQAFAVLAATFDGMPLIYGGQEAPLRKRLKFFEKDQIEWGGFEYADFYQTLFELKRQNKALWNGAAGGGIQEIATGNIDVFAFTREKEGKRVIVFLNLSELPQEFHFMDAAYAGAYNDVFANSTMTLAAEASMQLSPWSYIVLSSH